MPTSQRPAPMASSIAVSLANGGAAKLATQPFTICSVFTAPRLAIMVPTSDWLYTLFEVRKHKRPFHFASANAA